MICLLWATGACDSQSSAAAKTESHAQPSAMPPAAALTSGASARPPAKHAKTAGSATAATLSKTATVEAPEDVAAPGKDAKKTGSGLATKVLKKGAGDARPKPEDRVKVHYSGWTKDGRLFDSSVARGEPAVFGVTQVIPGWTEALQLMVEGEKRRVWIPAALAYGERPRMGAPAGQLTFDLELLQIIAAPKPLPAPPDVAAPPAKAMKTKSGLAYRQLAKGNGKVHPKATDRVTVHYTGWTKDGKMFDSSVTRGEPATFPLNAVIKGWTEGLQLMVQGDKMRFWIPAALAYGDKPRRPGAPAGQLTFDVELISIN